MKKSRNGGNFFFCSLVEALRTCNGHGSRYGAKSQQLVVIMQMFPIKEANFACFSFTNLTYIIKLLKLPSSKKMNAPKPCIMITLVCPFGSALTLSCRHQVTNQLSVFSKKNIYITLLLVFFCKKKLRTSPSLASWKNIIKNK